jgi:DNA-binding CsgD family transcriptional regulator
MGETVVLEEGRARYPGEGELLLERGAAVRAIGGGLEAAGTGEGGAVFVLGSAGIGKTSMLAAGRGLAAQAGFRLASAVGTPMEAGLPYGLIGQAVVALGGSPVEDVAELARLGGQPARLYRTFRFFAEAAAERPLLLTLDDLHWADADSLELLGFLCRRLAGARILVLGALRPQPDPASRVAEELLGSGHARVLTLEPLGRAAAESLVGEGLDPGERDRVLDSCAGSPLLLKVVAAALSGGASVTGLTANGAFDRSLLVERFVGLGAEASAYVRAASVLGVRFRPSLAGVLAGLDTRVWEESQLRLARAGLLDDLGSGWAAFVHPLFAQAVFDAMAPSERERAHERAFRLLVERGEPDAVAAEHAVAAGLAGDPLAVEVAARAGREALAQGALEAARSHLGHAVELAGDSAAAELLFDYATAIALRGRVDEARACCDRLFAREDVAPSLRSRALALLALTAMYSGEPEEAQRLYEQAAAATSDPAMEAAVLAEAVVSCHVASPLDWSLGILERALSLLPDGSPGRPDLAFLLAMTRLMQADPSGVAFIVQVMGSRLGEAGPKDRRGWTMATHAINVCKLIEDPGRATALFEREFGAAIEDGAPMLINGLAGGYADNAHRLGHLREALDLVQRALSVSGYPMHPWMDLALAALLTEAGEDGRAASHIDSMRSFLSRVPPTHYAPVWLWLDLLDCRRLAAEGDVGRASEVALHAAHVVQASGWRHPCIVPWVGAGIEAHVAAGRVLEARCLIAELEDVAARLDCRWPRAALAVGRAQLAALEDRHEEAERQFGEGLRILDELGMPIYRAEALVRYGAYLRRSGRPREARKPLAEALAIAEETGAGRVARLARAELSASGGRRRRRDDDRATLTAQEQRVAELAAGGLSNAQIAAALHLSPKTIGNYLERIYAKLDIHSRRDLIAQRASRPNDEATTP